MSFYHLKSETLGVLRNCQLLHSGELDGKKFVRCIPYIEGEGTGSSRTMTQLERATVIARCIADLRANGIADGCVLASNPEFGGDYLRVELRTPAYNAICHMKS